MTNQLLKQSPVDIAFDLGAAAYGGGFELSSNPYNREHKSGLFAAWADGWMAAREELLGRKEMNSELRTLLVQRFYICDEDEGIHEPDNPLDFDEAAKMLDQLRNENPDISYDLIALIDA